MKELSGVLATAARVVADRLGHESPLVRALRPAYEKVLAWLNGGRGIPWSINDVPCRIDYRVRDRLPRAYELAGARFLAQRIRPGDVCFDIGANVGAYVIQLAHWSRPTGCVVAFEPNPAAADLLEHHVTMNGLAQRVTVVRAAVGAEPGRAFLHVAGADGRGRLDRPNPELAGRTESVSVPVTTIDAFCEARSIHPHWLLIDIEGFEIAALAGARRVLTTPPRPRVVVEMHPSAWALSGTERAAVEKLLKELDVTPIPLSGRPDPLAAHALVYLSPAEP